MKVEQPYIGNLLTMVNGMILQVVPDLAPNYQPPVKTHLLSKSPAVDDLNEAHHGATEVHLGSSTGGWTFVMKLLMYIWIKYNCMIWYVYNCMICMDGWMLGQPGCQEHCFHPTCFFHSNSLKPNDIHSSNGKPGLQNGSVISWVLQQLDSFTSLKIRVFPASNTLPARYRMRLLSWCLVHCPRGSFCSHAMVWRRKWKIGCLQD